MQKEVQELKEISGVISKGAYNIAIAKAVQGDAPGENMMDVGNWQYTEFVHKMTAASIKTNLLTTILSWFSDTSLKKIKNEIYKKQNSNISGKELKDKLKKHINSPIKKGKCFTE